MSSSLCLSVATFGWLWCSVLYLITLLSRKTFLSRGVRITAVGVLLVHTLGIGLRWKESYDFGMGHAPLSNLYESLVFGAWAIMVVYLWIERRAKTVWLGFIPTLLAFLAMGYASFSPDVQSHIQPLIPALRSNWLIAHVVTCFLGYGAFAVSFGVSTIYLLRDRFGERGWMRVFPSTETLESLNYQLVAFGFLWLTVGIGTGAVWADAAWGTYWSWDPKETWSLITWLVYAALLHARVVRHWQGRRVAMLSITGFSCVLFTYFGVSFLLSGLHSYATR